MGRMASGVKYADFHPCEKEREQGQRARWLEMVLCFRVGVGVGVGMEEARGPDRGTRIRALRGNSH